MTNKDDGKLSLIEQGIRQGSYFSCDNSDFFDAINEGRSIAKYRKKYKVNKDYLFLVISQDCDIASKSDSYIEIIPLKLTKKQKEEPKIQFGRNFSKLQLMIPSETGTGQLLPYECETKFISIVDKSVLKVDEFKDRFFLEDNDLSLVIDWRVSRYSRKPFPHNFNSSFLFDYLKQDGNELNDFLMQNRDVIIDLHVYVNPAEDDNAKNYLTTLTALVFENVDDEKIIEIEDELRRHAKILHDKPNCLFMMQIESVDDDLILEEEFPPLDFVLKQSDMNLYDADLARRITLDYLCYS